MKEDVGMFEKAFNELNDEGFFKDFTAKARRLQVKTRADTKKTVSAGQKNGTKPAPAKSNTRERRAYIPDVKQAALQ